MKVLIAEINHESNTFCLEKTTVSHFKERCLFNGSDIIKNFTGTNSVLGGFIDTLNKRNIETVGMLAASAAPFGVVTSETFESVMFQLTSSIKYQEDFDGILLSLHGAMVSENYRSADHEILRRIKNVAGEDIPIVIALDLHANLDPKLCKLVNCIVACKTYPHVDFYETGVQAVEILYDILDKGLTTKIYCKNLNYAIPLTAQITELTWNKSINDLRLKYLTQYSDILDISILYGFYLADTENMGMSIVCTAQVTDEQVIYNSIEQLCEHIHLQLKLMKLDIYSCNKIFDRVNECFALDNASKIILADITDNPGAGAAGKSLKLLNGVIKNGLKKAIVSGLYFPEIIELNFHLNRGDLISFCLVDDNGTAIDIDGKLIGKHTGEYYFTGPYDAGCKVNYGKALLVDFNGVSILLHSARHQCIDPGMMTSIGVNISDYNILVLKSSVHFRAAFTKLVDYVFEVDTNGEITCNPQMLTFKYAKPEYIQEISL